MSVANRYCKELTYQISGRQYSGIGFGNNSGGFEIRNPYFKGSLTLKDFTTIESDSNEISVFEGFFDFLSFIVINPNKELRINNFMILNSVALFEKARPQLEEYDAIHLYLDHDAIGQNCTHKALIMSSKYQEESHLYENYKDLNEWVINVGKSQRRNVSPPGRENATGIC